MHPRGAYSKEKLQYSWTPVTRIAKGNWSYFELSGFRVIGSFEQKDQKHLIKVVLCLYMFYCKFSSNVRA